LLPGKLTLISSNHHPQRRQKFVNAGQATGLSARGMATSVIEWHERFGCSGCGSWQIEFMVGGTERR
jgi:hypothetical protein